jgi:hypothetical protein
VPSHAIRDRAVTRADVEDCLGAQRHHLLEHPRALLVGRVLREVAPNPLLVEPVADSHGVSIGGDLVG